MLLIPEGQMGEANEPSKKKRSFGNWGEMHREVLSPEHFSKQICKM
jgi:hypothetical protein